MIAALAIWICEETVGVSTHTLKHKTHTCTHRHTQLGPQVDEQVVTQLIRGKKSHLSLCASECEEHYVLCVQHCITGVCTILPYPPSACFHTAKQCFVHATWLYVWCLTALLLLLPPPPPPHGGWGVNTEHRFLARVNSCIAKCKCNV